MSCKSCSSSVKAEPEYYYNITAHNTICYNITIDEHKYTFKQSASASAGGNVHHIAALNAAKLAKGLTDRLARDHMKELVKNTRNNTSGDKKLRLSTSAAPVYDYKNSTTYSVESNDPRCSKNK